MKKIYQAPCVQIYRISVKSLISGSMDLSNEDGDEVGFAREDAYEDDDSQTKNHNVWDNEW